jgi:ubiquinone biosynthesis protein
MTRLRQLARLLRITRVFVRHDLDEFVTAIHLFRPYRLLLRLAPWRLLARRSIPRGVRLREALEELGPVFVKFGQMLSTRPGPAARRHRQRAGETAGSRAAVCRRRRRCASSRQALERQVSELVQRVQGRAHRLGLGGAGAHRRAPRRHEGGGQGAAVPASSRVIERDLDLLYLLARLALKLLRRKARRFRPVEVVG